MKGYAAMSLLGWFLTSFCWGAPADSNHNPEKIYLWPDGAPGALSNEEKDKPYIEFFPSKSSTTKATIIIFPGGGYSRLAKDHEGTQVVNWLNGLGMSVFMIEYRHGGKGYQHPTPLLDAQRAIRLVRYKAKEYNIDPNQIGIMGFSAGGHLASTAGTHFAVSAYEQQDETDKTTCRPDFMILVYPVITLEPPFYHAGSRNNLLGDNPPEDLVKSLCNYLHITKDTPPTFLIHANDDTAVPPENSIMFYEALRKVGVPAEMHIFLKGGHGFGMRKGVGPAEEWINLCEKWMRQSGWLTNNITSANKSSGS